MIIPFDKSQQSQGGQQAPGPKPSETDLLLALGAMHNAGRFDAMKDRIEALRDLPAGYEKRVRPGTPTPDRERGGTAARDVRID